MMIPNYEKWNLTRTKMIIHCHNLGRNISDEYCEGCAFHEQRISRDGCNYEDKAKLGWGVSERWQQRWA